MFVLQLLCCGSRGPQDYRRSYWYNQTKDEASIALR